MIDYLESYLRGLQNYFMSQNTDRKDGSKLAEEITRVKELLIHLKYASKEPKEETVKNYNTKDGAAIKPTNIDTN